MKKVLLLPIAFVALVFIVLHFSFGARNVYIDDIRLAVPNISFMHNESDTEVSFISFRSLDSLTNEIDKMLATLTRDECDEQVYFYDREQDITISMHFIVDRFLYREFGFTFVSGRECIPLPNNNNIIEDEVEDEVDVEEENESNEER